MNEEHGITAANILKTLPQSLREDESMVALAESIAEQLAKRPDEIDSLLIYPMIDSLPEDLLDILAYDFKVDWWDPDYDIETKRKTLKDSWYVHRHLGTRAAVERAISAVYPNTTLEEWFEYEDGLPYHFRARINITNDNVMTDRMRRILERLAYYKNLRSHLDSMSFFTVLDSLPEVWAFLAAPGIRREEHRELDCMRSVPVYTADTGARAAPVVTMLTMHTGTIDLVRPVPEYTATSPWDVGQTMMTLTMDAELEG